jgi:hypothetical protein
MSEQTLISVSCTLPSEFIPVIEEKAKARNMSRSEYLRTLILSGVETAASPSPDSANPPLSKDPIALLQQLLYLGQRLHIALYRMPKITGSLSLEQLQEISADAANMSIAYMADLDRALAKTRQQITAAQASQPQAAE